METDEIFSPHQLTPRGRVPSSTMSILWSARERRLHTAWLATGAHGSERVVGRAVPAATEAMNNAVRYAEGGEVLAFVDPHRVTIVVADREPGIAFGKLAHVPS